MRKEVVISVDAMGGENAPAVVVEGVAAVCKTDSYASFMLYGDESQITEMAVLYGLPHDRYVVVPTTRAISDDEKPVDALRNSYGTSMREAICAVKDNSASAFVSCGNTGAMMVIAKVLLGCLQNIKRPAIAGCMPTQKGRCVMLDLGANAECTKVHLLQFALMGRCFAKIMLDINNPTIGILNVGSEDTKGRALEQQTAEMLRGEVDMNFVGYVEGSDIMGGKTDVVVTDGFAGNVALKSAEGTVRLFLKLLSDAINNSLLSKIGGLLLRSSLRRTLSFIEPSNYNGAMLIGLNGIVVKGHGGSKTKDVVNAICVALELARHDINRKIEDELIVMSKHNPHGGIGKIVDKISEYLYGSSSDS